MFPRILTAVAVLAALAAPARAQVLRDLAPIELEYEIRTPGKADPIGTASLSFRPGETPRGRRLIVEARTDFTVGDSESAVEYRETVSLSCDKHGVEKFETVRRFGDHEERYLGVKTATDYAITSTVNGEVTQKEETGEVQRSNLGIFCGGFLDPSLGDGDIIVDFPLLFPALGRHYPRQKVRVGWVTVGNAKTPFEVIHSQLRRRGGGQDEIWNLNDERQPLVRMIETNDIATLVWSLVRLDGEDVSEWAPAIAAAFPESR